MCFGIASGKLTPLLHALSQTPQVRFVGVRHEASGADDGRGDVRRHRPRRGGARRDGAGRHQPRLRRGRGVQQPPRRAADHHQPAPRRGLPAPRHVHGHGHARRVRAADQVERGGATTRGACPSSCARRFARRSAAGPGRCTWTFRRTCWRSACEFADDEFDLAPARYRGVAGPRPAAAAVSEAAALLRGAQRPLIVAGGGVVAAQAQHEAARTRARGCTRRWCRRRWRWAWCASDSAALHRPRRPDRRRRRCAQAFDAGRRGARRSAAAIRAGCGTSRARSCGARSSTSTSTSIRRRSAQPALHDAGACRPTHAPRCDRPARRARHGAAAVGRCAAGCRGCARCARRYEARARGAGARRRDGRCTRPRWRRRDRPRAAARRAGRLRRRPHQLLEQRPARRCTTCARASTTPACASSASACRMRWRCSSRTPAGRCSTSPATARSASRCRSSTRRGATGLPVVTLIHNNAAWGIIRAGQRQPVRLRARHRPRRHRLRGDRARLRLPRRNGRRAGRRGRRDRSVRSPAGCPRCIDCRTRFVPHPCMPAFGA